MSDPRLAGFVRAVSAVMGEPEVEAALALDARVLQEGLEPWVARAQEAGQVRTDLSARDLTAWVLVLLDGFLGRIAVDAAFTAAGPAGRPARRRRAGSRLVRLDPDQLVRLPLRQRHRHQARHRLGG